MLKSTQNYIADKAHGKPLTEASIDHMVSGFIQETVTPAQMSAWITACYIHGLNEEETILLTKAMAASGDILTWPEALRNKGQYRLVDKHSTGGIGDKTTLIVIPLVASFGYPVVKLSGRSLGHTGGTVDKLESIPGLRTDFNEQEIANQVAKIGLYIGSSTGELAPADKKIYQLRDHLGLIDEAGLITASIISKKIASGADAFVFDVKYGQGAFMTSYDKAVILANRLQKTCEYFHKPCTAILSDMNEPLGNAIGNALEVQEAVRILSGQESESILTKLSIKLAAQMLHYADPSKEKHMDWAEKCRQALQDGSALNKFQQMVAAQGGCLEEALAEETEFSYDFYSKKAGRITGMNAKVFGQAAHNLGAGALANDPIHPAAGIVLDKHIGDTVFVGERIASLQYDIERSELLYPTLAELEAGITIDESVDVNPFQKEN